MGLIEMIGAGIQTVFKGVCDTVGRLVQPPPPQAPAVELVLARDELALSYLRQPMPPGDPLVSNNAGSMIRLDDPLISNNAGGLATTLPNLVSNNAGGWSRSEAWMREVSQFLDDH